MKIDILATHGSPLGVTSRSISGLDGRMGVGGAELALLTMCEAWAGRGDEVTLYNDPLYDAPEQKFRQAPVGAYDRRGTRDVLITFRSPHQQAIKTAGCLKVWWSTDQFTVGDYAGFAKWNDKIVCISPFHQNHFAQTYGIGNTVSIDLPVRVWEYQAMMREKQLEKIPNRFLFSSVPDRGLGLMTKAWKLIHQLLPDSELVITSDYRLWGADYPGNEQYRAEFLKLPNVKFLGAVKRERLIEEQLLADYMVYPCIYPELFCYAVAEAEIAGILTITSDLGALTTTNMGTVIPNIQKQDSWNSVMIENLTKFSSSLKVKWDEQHRIQEQAYERFHIKKVLELWDKLIFSKG
jgi:glycosyltransferase involved in cell wall biosynthesis